MHPHFEEADGLSRRVIGAAIEVHRAMGPGLLESIYEQCLVHELGLRGISVQQQLPVQVRFKDLEFEHGLRLDLLVERCLLIELKSVQEILPVHKAQLMSYMKLVNAPVGLVINFHEERLVEGVSRLILPGANLDRS